MVKASSTLSNHDIKTKKSKPAGAGLLEGELGVGGPPIHTTLRVCDRPPPQTPTQVLLAQVELVCALNLGLQEKANRRSLVCFFGVVAAACF